MTKTYIDELAEEIARLREQNNKLNEMCNYWRIEETERTMECYKLKQLLKECWDEIKHLWDRTLWDNPERMPYSDEFVRLDGLKTKIDEVLK